MSNDFNSQTNDVFDAYCAYLDLVDELGAGMRDEARNRILHQHPQIELELRKLFNDEPGTPALHDFQVGSIIEERYRLLQKLGEGGMGTVWLVQQLTPVRRLVALKVIKRGLDSEQILARFEAERQALAMMEHESIATFHDAGLTTDGRSFFVMEFVPGVPITTYCDSVALSLNRRLELFQKVCAAVQHAHQKGIIHRDLKPSNILVSDQHDQLTVKIIDFGLAKALTQKLSEKSIYTEHGQILGTWQYMPPEQAELSALNVDTRADVYALGAILYELISGTPPLLKEQIKDAAYDAVVKMIRDSDFPRPSVRLSRSRELIASISAARRSEPKKLLAELNGDLDWIALKALEKDRTLRYGSAEDLRRDVGRYLNNEAIEARPPSFSYKAKKWLRRHRVAAAFVAVSVFALFATLGGTSFGLFKSQHSLGVAKEAREDEAKQAEIARDEAARAKRLQTRAEQQQNISDWRLYMRTLAAAASAAEDGELEAASRLLDSTPDALRGFEYGHCRSSLSAIVGKARIPADQICSAIAVGPKRLFAQPKPAVVACGTTEGAVWFGSLENQAIDNFHFEPRLRTDSGAITSLAFSESGRLLVAGTSGGRVAVSDTSVKLNHVIGIFNTPGFVTAVSIRTMEDSVAGELSNVLVAAADYEGNILVWDVIQEAEMARIKYESSLITSIAIGNEQDGFALVVGDEDGTIKFWDSLDNAKPPFVETSAHSGGVFDVEMNDLGVTTCGRDGNRIEWKIESIPFVGRDLKSAWMRRSQLPKIKIGQVGIMCPQVIWVGLDPKSMQQGKEEFVGCFLEDTRTGVIQAVANGLDESFNRGDPILPDISGTGDFLAVGVGSDVHLRLRMLEKITMPVPKAAIPRIPGLRLDLRLNPMAKVFLVEIPNFDKPLTSTSPVASVARNHALDAVVTASKDGTISLWKITSKGRELADMQIDTASSPYCDRPIAEIGFSADDQWLLVSRESNIEIFSVSTGVLHRTSSFDSPIRSFETTAGGRLLISAGNTLYHSTIDVPDNRDEISLGKPAGRAVIHPDGTWIAAISDTDEVLLHNVSSDLSTTLMQPGVSSILFHPDESRLVTVGRSLRLWELESQENVWSEEMPPNQRGPFRLHLTSLETLAVLIGVADVDEYWQIQTWNADMK